MNIKRQIAFLFAALLSAVAFGQTVLNVGTGTNQDVPISRKDFNRIAVFEGGVKTIKFKKGELDISPDADTGTAFLLPNVNGKISAFVITFSGQAHQLNLIPSDIPAQSIVLREPKLDGKSDLKISPNEPKTVATRLDRANSYDVAIRRVIGAMARGEKLADLKYEEINKEFQLWQGTRMWLMAQFIGQTYMGENYRIQNTSNTLMRIDEREFYKPGVLAVSIEVHDLQPNEATDIFIVKEVANGK